MKILVMLAVCALPCWVSAQALQIIPSAGAYSNPARQGEGAFVEVQGNLVGIAFFTHRSHGDSTFYTIAGPMYSVPFNEAMERNYYPATRVEGDLFETRDGPVLNVLASTNAESRKVGTARVEFGYLSELYIYVQYNEEPDSTAPPRSRVFVLSKMNFGFGAIGSRFGSTAACWQDIRGEWIFVDQSNPQANPLRLNFTEMSSPQPLDQIRCGQGASSVVTFRDPSRTQVMRCVSSAPDFDGVNRVACELREGEFGETLYWFSPSDMIGARMIGSVGAYEPNVARLPAKVTAFRVQ